LRVTRISQRREVHTALGAAWSVGMVT